MATAEVITGQEEQAINNSVETTALTTAQQAKAITVTDAEGYNSASEMVRGIVAIRRQVEQTFAPMKKKAHEAWKEVVAQEKKLLEPLEDAETYLKRQIGGYVAREEAARREQENRLRLEAQKLAEEAARREAEEAALASAIAAEQQGDTATAEAVLAAPIKTAPVFVAPIIVPRTVQKQEGLSARKTYKFRVVNESLVPREYLKVDEVKIGQVVAR
jgi:hypothetical protein